MIAEQHVIYHHHQWAAVVSKACLQVSVTCALLCQIVSLRYLLRLSLHYLAGLPCRLFLSYGLQVVKRKVHRSCLRRLMCPAQDQFIFLTLLIMSVTFFLSLTQMLVLLFHVILRVHFSILVCASASLFCNGQCPVLNFSAPYVIAGSMQELTESVN